jgi:predicted transposase/invertase (TIGR01784 family)
VDEDRINNSTNNVKSITHEEVKTMFSTTLEKIKIKEKNKGELKGKIEAAKRMKKEGFNFDVISRIIGLS